LSFIYESSGFEGGAFWTWPFNPGPEPLPGLFGELSVDEVEARSDLLV
jgi:hypothetical protein